jgi:eukaryotic-like serine/threonine-protein kinase
MSFEASKLRALIPEKYSDVAQLCPGRNAAVFAARDIYLERPVFLKIYRIPADDPGSALREPQTLEALQHQNLTKIYSVEPLEGGYLLLSMELVTGGSFDDFVREREEAWLWNSTRQVMSLVNDVAKGLSHLHLNRFVHRDIKPANLMIRSVGAALQGVVTDLGLASKLDAEDKAYATKHAKLYRPPEVWQGHSYGPSSDIYQLGITLYQLLGGRLDFSLSEDNIARRAIEGKLLDFDSLIPCVSKALQSFIRKCICPKPDRFAKMCDFMIGLNNIRTAEPDWSCQMVSGETHIFREDDSSRSYRFIIRSNENAHYVTREKRVKDGPFRKDGEPLFFSHKTLCQSQKLQSFLRK